MLQRNKNWEIIKNVIDLEYRKLLHEYNAILIAITSVTIGILVFVYNTTRNVAFSLIVVGIVYIVLDLKREEISQKLNLKIKEAKSLRY